jgi:hypothetical protein
MDIRVDGSRSDTESWIQAHEIPLEQLPALSDEEISVAGKLAIPVDEYRRARYAVEISRKHLEERASKVGLLVQKWMADHSLSGRVDSVWLKTLAGKYRVDIEGTKPHLLFFEEDAVDDMLEGGSEEASHKFDRVLSLNLLDAREAAAS